MTGTPRRAICIVAAAAIVFVLAARTGFAQSEHGSVPADHGHAEHGQPAGQKTPEPEPGHPATHEHSGPPVTLSPFIPAISDQDRAAAFPDVEGHTVHDSSLHSFVLLDRFEWQGGNGGGIVVDSNAWVGFDRDRLWIRGDGAATDERIEAAQFDVLYGRHVARWWDVVAGIRLDLRPGDAQTWAAIGVQGLAPYWFDVQATAYVGASGRTRVRVQTEYDLLITNRLMLQPVLELDVYGKSDPPRGIGAGLAATDVGLRLRYEIRRELAPYAGVTWQWKHGKTADFAREAGDAPSAARFVVGVRTWF